MNLSDYFLLKEACDRILKFSRFHPDVVSIPWLHILNEHPSNLGKYNYLFERKNTFFSSVRRKFLSFLKRHYRLFRAFISHREKDVYDKVASRLQVNSGIDVVLISNLVSPQGLPPSDDFYYGKLKHDLQFCGFSCFTIFRNNTSSRAGVLQFSEHNSELDWLVLPRWSNLHEELSFYRRAKIVAKRIKTIKGLIPSKEKKICGEAVGQANSSDTISSLQFHYELQKLLLRIKPKVIVVLWEGHAWERMALHAARSVRSDAICVAYQHSLFFPHSHALKRCLVSVYEPNIVLTIGQVTYNLLRSAYSNKAAKLLIYGSHRRVKTEPKSIESKVLKRRCIVLPDGIISECQILFEFAISLAIRLPKVDFIFRTHPIISFHQLQRKNPSWRSLPINVSLSKGFPIEDEFEACSWSLYRGSSAAFFSVFSGVRPIYLMRDRDNGIDIDPMIGLNAWRRKIRTLEDFRLLVEEDIRLNPETRRSQWEVARDFCEMYIKPVNSDSFLESINHRGL